MKLTLVALLLSAVGTIRAQGCDKTVYGSVKNGDDKISSAACSGRAFVSKCECVATTSGGYCDGVTVSADGKTCNAHGAKGGINFKAKACCTDFAWQVSVVSNPSAILQKGLSISQKAGKYIKNATVRCPSGTQLVNCVVHTYWAPVYGQQTPVVSGNTCSAPSKCPKCGVQAVCMSLYPCSNVEGPTVNGDDKISTAKCPEPDAYVMNCQCVTSGSGYCDGVTLSADGRSCLAHGAKGGINLKARACCGRLPGSVSVLTKPEAMLTPGLSISQRASKYFKGAAVTCPTGSNLVTCVVHTYWAPIYGQQKAVVSGNTCSAPSKCPKCGVQAICQSHAPCKTVDSSQTINGDDKISTATCPADSYAAKCECLVLTRGGYCDGVTVSADGRSCLAHGAKSGFNLKARACCRRLPGKITVQTNPAAILTPGLSISQRAAKYFKGASVTCPAGNKVVTCLAHTYWAPVYGQPKAVQSGNKCSAPAKCPKCGVQAVCLGYDTCRIFDSSNVVNGDDKISTVTCPAGQYVKSCECVSLTKGGYCDGVTLSADGKSCLAHGATSGFDLKARACCGILTGKVSVLSKPTAMVQKGLSISQRAGKYIKGATVTCPKGSRLVTCVVHTYWAPMYGEQTAVRNGNTCSAPSSCKKCGVQALCQN